MSDQLTPISPTDDVVENPASNSNKIEKLKRTGKPKSRRASNTTKFIANLLREDQGKSSWIVGLMFFKSNPGFETLKRTIVDRLMVIPRFRSRLKVRRFPVTTILWEEIHLEDIDEDYHFRVVLDDGPKSVKEVNDYCGALFDDFDHDMSKPLWQFYFIPQLDDGRCCLVTNISHIIGDGVSQVEVLLKMLDEPQQGKLEKQQSARPPRKRKPVKLGPITKARVFLGGIWDGFFAVMGSPDPANSLRLKDVRKPSPKKNCCVTEPLDLNRVKLLKNKFEGATINDILMTVLTLTLKAHFIEVNDEAVIKKGGRVRAQFPINLRKRGEHALKDGVDARNKFAYGFFDFPMKSKVSRVDLVWKLKRTLDKIKQSPSPLVQGKVGGFMARVMPLKAMNSQLLNLANKATAQISNVAGPQDVAHLAGVEVDDLMFYLFSPLGMYIGILTYNGKLSVAISLDSTIGDPNMLAKHWNVEFEKLFDEAMAIDEETIFQPRPCINF